LEPFFRYSVSSPSDDDIVDHLTVDDENYDEDVTGLLVPFALPPTIQERKPKYLEHRRNGMWEELLVKCRHKGDFVSTFHMTESSFHKLVDLLAPHLHVDEVKSRNSTSGTQPIDRTIIVAAGLRWLGGEPYKSVADIFHFSRASARRVVARFIDAVIESLQICLPTTNNELEAIAAGWTQKSSGQGCYHGLVLALDGYLSTRTVPSRSECPNAADFFSGHKKIPALNVQAAIDHMLRFRYIAVAAPGKTNDRITTVASRA
jgi:hypothetical protein